MESLYFLIPLFFIIIFAIPISFKLKIALNANAKEMTISLYVFKFCVMLVQGRKIDNKFVMYSLKSHKKLKVDFSNKQLIFYQKLSIWLLDNVNIRKFSIYSVIGSTDAFDSACLAGGMSSLTNIVFAILKSNKPNASFFQCGQVRYNQNIFSCAIYLSFAFSIFDMIYYTIKSLLIKRRVYER